MYYYMIPIQSENLIAIRDVPKHLPARPNAKRVHISACYRWISNGVRGVVLESWTIGGTTYTSLEALQRFSLQLTRRSRAAAGRCEPSDARRLRSERTKSRLELELGLPAGRLSKEQQSIAAHRGDTA